MTIVANVADNGEVERAAILRTARKLFDGMVFAG
jgi:2-methylaconitate cis-trans-isomerase PrpF